VIGGIVARIGDVVIDGSLAHSMEELRHTVLSR
jgi:F0F1-type ATP synthase delta subunit